MCVVVVITDPLLVWESVSAVLMSNQSAVRTEDTHLTRVMWPHGFSFPEVAQATGSLFVLYCECNVPPGSV